MYNTFYVGDDCDVTIVAGCGIHNESHKTSEHDGIHTFYCGKNSHVKYVGSTTAKAREPASAF